jgi:hypothetical protein
MKPLQVRLKARWLVLAVIFVGIVAVVAGIDRRERLQREIAIETSQTAYRNARLARERAEAQLGEYVEVAVPRELATAETAIREAEDDLNRILNPTSTETDWSERIESKGWLLFYRGLSKELRVKQATFALEQAQSQKLVLEEYTKVQKEKVLKDRVAKARAEELAKKAAYLRMQSTPVGLFGRLMRRF